jgi:hypothetical protein
MLAFILLFHLATGIPGCLPIYQWDIVDFCFFTVTSLTLNVITGMASPFTEIF